jgi:hypothetical protein
VGPVAPAPLGKLLVLEMDTLDIVTEAAIAATRTIESTAAIVS